MNFKHELSPSKPLLRSTQSLILGFRSKQKYNCLLLGFQTPKPCDMKARNSNPKYQHQINAI